MWRKEAGVRLWMPYRQSFGLILGLCALVATAAMTGAADARSRHRHARAASTERYEPPYASIVVDANTGAVLQSSEPDSSRHPASLTKIMTLYLLFERLESGRIKPTTELNVSEHASVQAPSKLGLKPGETINVETAIRAIVTKSANDVAVVVAEAIGGSESEFAREMTKTARSIGMTHTVYVNASGLPNDEQVTTARDQATLGRAIQERFPKYYKYFSTLSFNYRGHAMRNHNKLLGSVDGVDGIKTGYTNASGFNLITSLRRDGRHVVAAVFGGRTANWRDARMRELIGKYIRIASREQKGAKVEIAKAKDTDKALASGGPLVQTASAEPMTLVAPKSGSTEPIKPNAVKTLKVKMASLAGAEAASGRLMPPQTGAGTVTTIATVKSETPLPLPPGNKPGVLGVLPVQMVAARDSEPAPAPAPAIKRGAYIIQVGAFDEESLAKARLSAARSKADVLAKADPFTERVAKGDKSLYRARFAGLDKDQAEAACKSLKRGEIPCMLLKNE